MIPASEGDATPGPLHFQPSPIAAQVVHAYWRATAGVEREIRRTPVAGDCAGDRALKSRPGFVLARPAAAIASGRLVGVVAAAAIHLRSTRGN